MKKICFIIVLAVGLACSNVSAGNFKMARPGDVSPDHTPARITSPVVVGFTKMMNSVFGPKLNEEK
jgi:hypothetical protein